MDYSFSIEPAAQADLLELRKTNPTIAARIVVVLDAVKSDQALLSELLTHNFGERSNERWSSLVGIKKIVQWWNNRPYRDLWRLKIWDLERQGVQYRIVYAYFPRARKYCVLGVFPRRWNYDPNDTRSLRVTNDYDELRRSLE